MKINTRLNFFCTKLNHSKCLLIIISILVIELHYLADIKNLSDSKKENKIEIFILLL